jgi:hypothetical protein
MKRHIAVVAMVLALFVGGCVDPDKSVKQEAPANAGFLSDYSLLTAPDWPNSVVSQVYIDPKLAETIAKYSGVMVDQPEIFLSRDSSYRGVKPEGMKLVADLIRFKLIGEMLRGGYNVVESPAEDVVYLRVALTDLELEKAQGVSGYVPMSENEDSEAEIARGFMATLTIVDVSVEIELVDSITHEVIIAGIAHKELVQASDADDMASWVSLGRLLEDLSAGISCLVNKAALPADARRDICRGSTELEMSGS